MYGQRRIARIVSGAGLLMGLWMVSNQVSLARDKYEAIEAQAYGTGTQMGANIGVTLNIYEFSTPADKQILVQAYEKGQNQGLVNALQRMKAVGHVEITGTLGNDCSFIKMIPTPTGRKITEVACVRGTSASGYALDYIEPASSESSAQLHRHLVAV